MPAHRTTWCGGGGSGEPGQHKPPGDVSTAVLGALPSDSGIRRLAERDHNVVRWTEIVRGGNFLSMEHPTALGEDVRAFFADVRAAPAGGRLSAVRRGPPGHQGQEKSRPGQRQPRVGQ
ncbi:hypothetical protein [Embleya sp. NBC_00888]|uniref:hypothetical protein n=1 Tax=Embleya sp. NBC_00888 TaxID=2975960 RepID=UPI00386BD968